VSATTSVWGGGTAWSMPKARWFLVAVHLAVLAPAPVIVSFGIAGEPGTGPAVIAVPLGLAILALQLRHSVALARGVHLRGGLWTLLALAVLVYLPLPWFGWSWVWMQACLMASAPMVLPRWPAAVAVAAPVLGTDVVTVVTLAPAPASTVTYWLCWQTFTLVVISAALYGSARLVREVDELQATRAELAELAVGRERLRVSRDLHDLLGHSLASVSLKGDLAIRLLRKDPPAARAEIESLTGVARDALRGMRAVTRDEHAVSLHTETDGAATLLRAVGIATHVTLDLPDLSPPVEAMLAWAVREGVTNVLRHSEARTCSIIVGHRNGTVWLEIVNDGVRTPRGEGSGLAGLAERAEALSGSVSAEHTPDDRFKLLIKVPKEIA
jgi:two-component system sensor histidine kinase DesK